MGLSIHDYLSSPGLHSHGARVPQAQEAGRGWVPGCLQLGLGSGGGGCESGFFSISHVSQAGPGGLLPLLLLQLPRSPLGGFPGGPVVKTPRFHCRERRFSPWSGQLRSRKVGSGQRGKKKKTHKPSKIKYKEKILKAQGNLVK